MLNRHLSFRDVSGILAALVLLLGTLGCAQKEEMGTAMGGSSPGAGEIPVQLPLSEAEGLHGGRGMRAEDDCRLSERGQGIRARG